MILELSITVERARSRTMTDTQIGVGIIGVEPGRSWSAVAHIPALRSLPQYRLVALSTRRQESADAAARAYGIEHAFDNYQALVSHPEVDLVVVSVTVPYHLELVSAAIAAGKSVYSEWPLGNGLDEAIRMADLARGKPLSTSVGLQARFLPVLRYVRDLIAEGHIGEVLSSTLTGNGLDWARPSRPRESMCSIAETARRCSQSLSSTRSRGFATCSARLRRSRL
jgi:predicted dehydrogenase